MSKMKMILAILFISLLSGCWMQINPPEVKPYLNRPLLTPDEITIIEWGDSLIFPSEIYVVLGKRSQSQLQSSQKIIGFIPKNTSFFIREYRVPEGINDQESQFTIEITSGTYKGKIFIMKNNLRSLLKTSIG